MYSHLICDFDGVVSDSLTNQLEWFTYISNLLGVHFPYTTLEEMRKIQREPYTKMYDELGLDWTKNQQIIWREYSQHKKVSTIPVYDGIKPTLSMLYASGIKLAIASSNTHEEIHRRLQENEMTHLFSNIISYEDVANNGNPRLKPDPLCLILALRNLGATPENSLYVGDQVTDIVAANRVEEFLGEPLPVVGVTYGFSTRETLGSLIPIERLIDEPKQLLQFFTD